MRSGSSSGDPSNLPDEKFRSDDQDSSTGTSLLQLIFYVSFVSTFVLTLIAVVLFATGHNVVAERFVAPINVCAFGMTFIAGTYLSWRNYGYAEVLKVGRVSRDQRSALYYALLSIPAALGVGTLILGIALLVRNLI